MILNQIAEQIIFDNLEITNSVCSIEKKLVNKSNTPNEEIDC